MKKNVWTKALSMLLALVMVVGMIPTTAVAVLADGVPESLVTSLAGLYDGDEARAREELEALRDAGIIDENGNLAALDICEDGERVELSALAQRIASGEDVGAITVNGHDATTEQIVQIQQVNSLLELLQMIDKDVEITDEHVANLKALVEGIADGSIDLSDVIKSGTLTVSNQRNAQLLTAASEEEVDNRIVQALYDTKDYVDIPYQSFQDVQNDLNALLSAGIIDSAGNFVAEFVLKEDGEDAELGAVAQRIQDEETVGSLTINGNSVSPDFLTQISMVKRLLVATQQYAQTGRLTREMANEYAKLDQYFYGLPDISADILSKFAGQMKKALKDPAEASKEVDETIVRAVLDMNYNLHMPYQSYEDVQKDLDGLLAAGIIDSAGNFVAKFVLQEGGKDAELDAVAQRIQGGETVGSLTIDGNSVSPDFITQIYKVKRLLVIAQKTAQNEMTFDLLNEEIQLGDYFSNLLGISADYLSKLGAELKFLIRDPAIAEAIPADASGSGKVPTQDGKYVAPCINGESYEEAHSFTSSESGTTFWYSVDEYDGVVAGNTVSLNYSYANNVIEARLNRQQPGDVSFDWKIVSSVMNNSQSLSGTITWAADDGGIKVIPLQVPGDRGGDLWRGKRANAVFSASNIENAIFAGGATGWSHVIQGSRDDQKEIAVSTGEYSMPTLTADQFTKYDVKNYQGNYERWYVKRITGLPQNISIARITPLLDKANGNLYCTVYLVSPDAEVGGEPVITYENQRMDNFHLYYHQSKFLRMSDNVFTIRNDTNRAMSTDNKCLVSGATLVKKSSDKPDGTTDFENGSYTTNPMDVVSAKGEVWMVVGLHKAMLRDQIGQTSIDDLPPWTSTPDIALSKLDMHCWRELPRKARVEDINIPQGTYYSGEIVPITVTLNEYVWAGSCRLTVNGTSCPSLDEEGAWTKKLTFGYTVKAPDAATINVTGLSGLYTIEHKTMDVDGDFPSESFGPQEGVTLVSDVRGSLDMAKSICGISDDKTGKQIVTVMIPFKSGADKTWVVNEAAEIGKALELPVPGYSDGEATYYLAGAYFSCNGGKTRYPVYLVNSGGQEGVALATRFRPAMNTYPALRKDRMQLFLDAELVSVDTAEYLPAWDSGIGKPEDAVFDGTERPDAPIFPGVSWEYYVKGSMCFDAAKYIQRGGTWDTADQGFIHTDSGYVLVGDAENPANQYDVEITANKAFFDAVKSRITVDSAPEMTLGYQISGRRNFDYAEPENFTWAASDSTIATVEKDAETGEGQIVLTGQGGRVKFLLTVGNGSAENAYTLETPYITVLEGSEPFLSIPKRSQIRTTLTGTDTDVAFTSNVTARNAALEKETVFTAKLYRVSAANETPGGDPIWTENFPSTTTKTVTHVTVPGNQLPDAGYYAVVIETRYEGGVVGGVETAALDLSATAYLNAKNPPARVTLNKLESYYVTSDKLPAIGYTVTPASAAVEYTIQKSGSPVGERTSVSSGTLPFTAETPTGLKDAYTITVYARNNESEAWSADSMLLTVYNKDALDIIIKDVAEGEIGGTTGGAGAVADNATIAMDNRDKLANYGVTDDNFQLTFDDFATLRTDMSLQKIISANYGTGVWGMLSDKMQWSSSDPDTVSVDYKQGGFYSDIRNYAYTSYIPTSDFLLVGKGDTAENVTITATHANTGMRETFDVTANALENELYLFQFSPKTTTTVTYTNGDGVERRLTSNDQGQLAVYEPEGITGTLRVMSTYDGETYVASLLPGNLVSGERDVTSLQLYACNNVRLRTISRATLIFLKPDGTAYNGSVTLRGGVYKNNIYCPDALIKTSKNETEGKNGREDITLQVTDGKLNLWFDPTQFRVDTSDEALNAQDSVAYAIEYRFEDSNYSYQPGYVILYAGSNYEGSAFSTDSVIQLRDIVGSPSAPQISRMDFLQYYKNENEVYQRTPFMRSVMDHTGNIGISQTYGKAVLFTDIALPDENIVKDERGYASISGDHTFALYTASGKKLTGQSGTPEPKQIVDLRALDDTAVFVFPFSAVPMARSVYTMTDENMKADGLTDEGENPTSTTPVKAMITTGGMTVRTITLPFGVSNLSHQPDLTDRNNAVGQEATNVKTELGSKLDVGQSFKEVNVNSMLKSGFTFLTGMSCQDINSPFNLMILPTEDPGIFRIVVFIGFNQKQEKGDDEGLTLNLDPNEMYEDISSLIEEESSPVSFDFRFSGTLILEAGFNLSNRKWQIDFCGGSVGMGFGLKFEWSQTFFCGPVPAVITFGLNADADVKVSFISKAAVKSMLVDATIDLSIEAFVGLGFDVTVAKLKLGIYGSIGADTNFLYLKKFAEGNSNGTKLTINGEIGIRLEIKLLFIKYKKTFCSTGFDWTKKWGKYDSIQEQWDSNGYAELLGVTQSGRTYLMHLFADGTALVAIDGAGELESRDYLDLYERVWNGGVNNTRNAAAMTNVETNAYPDSNPVFTDDGGMFFYLSDNNNAEAVESVASYAVKNGSGYEQGKRVDTSEDNTLADLDIVASGTAATGDNDTQNSVFAAWVKQVESPEKEKGTAATYDDLGMMMNATEIYVGTYTPKEEQEMQTIYIPQYGRYVTVPVGSIYPRIWNVERLTDNTVADMAPTVASYNNKAIVAWRSLSAAQMPEEGGSEDLTAMFNAENSINYRIGTNDIKTGKVTWTDAKVAYNGGTGTVNAIDSAMLSDGTSILVYTVRTGEDMTSTETFYTVIDKDGNAVTTGRLTNDDYTDTNAQVTAVGNQFLIGWYSEHDAGEGATQEYQFDTEGNPVYQENGEPVVQRTKAVVAHDIRLARIDANGSVDISFPESIGGTSAADISADFRFSAPAKNTNLNQVSIVWSQRKGSDVAEDAGKYELNAVRFFQEDSAIGVTAPTNIAETDQYFTIDQFDAYTDASGTVHAIVLGSDYSSVDGIHLYDTIDLSAVTKELTGENSADPSEDSLNVLEIDPVSYMKLAAGAFPAVAADVTADTDVSDLMPGVSLPVQFTVTNTGTSVIGDVTATVGGQSKTFTGLNLLPNQSTALIMCYDVPEGAVQDAAYSVVSGSTTLGSGTLTLNRPDVGISTLRILRESDGTRDIQIILSNDSDIPLAGSGKTVKLALYKDALHKNRIGKEVTITDAAALDDIDADIYTTVQTINVTDLYTGDEIPEEGLTVYAHAWVVDTEEPNIYNNDSYLKFRGLLARNNGERITADSTLEVNTNAQNEVTGYTVYADIRNNSMQETELDAPVAVLLDSEGNELASENLQEEPLTLKKEERNSTLSATFKAVNGTPALAMILFSSKEKQTISAENVTATYGDTGKSVSASVTEPATGGGAISYAVKPGSEDYIDVDASTGALTIKKAGTATVTVTAAETETHAAATKDVTVTIQPKTMTVTAPNVTAAADGQPHGITVTATDPGTGYTVKYGTTEGSYTLDASPTQTEVGTLTIYYQVTADNYTTYTGSATVTVSNKQTQTISAENVTTTYGDTGKSVSASVTEPATGGGAISYAVKPGSEDYIDVDASTGALTIKKAGTATVTVTAAETETHAAATKDVTVTIHKATPSYTVPTGLTAAYGQTLADVSLPSADNGVWAWKESSTSVGNAGEHSFQATFTPTDTDNYNTVSDIDVTVTVGATAAAVTTVPSAITLTYNGTAQALVNAGTASGGTMQYALGTDSATAPSTGFSGTVPTGRNAGTYYVWYKAVGDENHADSEPAFVSVTIKDAQVVTVKLNLSEKKLLVGQDFTLTATVAPTFAVDKTITWSSSNKKVATVSKKGVVKAVRAGSCVITATSANGVKAKCKITVKYRYVYQCEKNGVYRYTTSAKIVKQLQEEGWGYKKVFRAAGVSGTKVYWVYNKTTKRFRWTTDRAYAVRQKKAGNKAGLAFYASDSKSLPIYELCKEGKRPTYFYTMKASEVEAMQKAGWKSKGIAFYSEPKALR